METLFKFVLTRPAVSQSEDAPSILLAQNTPFQSELAQAVSARDRRAAFKAVAARFVKDPSFVGDPKSLPAAAALRALDGKLYELEKQPNVLNADLLKAIEESFGEKPAVLIERKVLEAPKAFLKDSILAIKLLPEEHSRPIEGLTKQLRDLEVIEKAVVVKEFPGTGTQLLRYRRRSLLLPGDLALASVLSTRDMQEAADKRQKEAAAQMKKQAEDRINIYKRLSTAIDELVRVGSGHIQETQSRAQPGFLVAANLRPVQIFSQEMARNEQLSQLNLLRAQISVGKAQEPTEGVALSRISTAALAGVVGPERLVSVQATLKLQNGSPEFTPQGLGDLSFRLKPGVESILSAPTLSFLQERKLSLTELPLDHLVEGLRSEQKALAMELDQLFGRPMQLSLKRIGTTLVKIATPLGSEWNNLVFGNVPTSLPFIPFDNRIPHTQGKVDPSGVADLLIVKQQLIGYETADVAHIESILKGEKKEREHMRRRETEEFTLRESETTTTEERELESTNRFELSRETDNTLKEDASLKAGLTLSGKYGPTVDFSASAEGSLSRSKEEATKTAAQFSQEVTQRSASKLTERVLQRATLKVTDEVIEKNNHTLDNTTGAANISGVYQWVNKVYQAQMFNYGLRTLFDFMVPEPGAFLIEALQNSHAHALELEKPMVFPLTPDQISETNYHSWVLQYGATDVTPPPEIFKTKSLDYNAGGGDENTDYNHSGQIQIEEGYKAIHGSVGRVVNIWEDNCSVDVVLGSRTHRFPKGDWMWSTNLDGELDSVPFALNTYKISHLAVAVEVKCQRTDRALLKWRLETHAKLATAYKARLAEYEEKLANLEMQAGVVIKGKNPALNQELMNTELRKNCISILTAQHFDLFDSISMGPNGLPEINLYESEAEGSYVRFFEQAFEWEHMTWIAYPYFWGRKSKWEERIAYEDVDPLFNQFLKAGYCRVVVPVRPGFEGAVDHFMNYGELWNGGPLPAISSRFYLAIADEIAERLARPGEEVPQGDPWKVRVPTTLVHLRADDRLPKWTQNAAGEWVPE
ncbi:MAG: hypothetical protein ABI036_20595 [Fibrobacteria bacterium]